jgi:uncharacterized protein YeaO (DUF488 family)
MIKTRRIYDKPEADDGLRILVDRIWPRGLKKNDVKIDYGRRILLPAVQQENGLNMIKEN